MHLGAQTERRVAVVLALYAVLLAGPVAARDPLVPAELPPPDYRGQQYVDSRGCMFLRAGTSKATEWIPRVTREGVPLCGNPPSGQRVPIVGEAGAEAQVVSEEAAETPASPPPPEAAPDETEAEGPTIAGGHMVAVGSFSIAENADKAVARLKALNYPVAKGRIGGSDGPVTVFAGPFATVEAAANAERELRGAGFPDAVQMSL